MIPEKLKKLLLNKYFLFGIYVAATAGATIVQYFKTKPGAEYTSYNNYIIFRESFHHLKSGIDLYRNHEPEHFDLYKYSPAFAVFFAPFNSLPDLPGLMIWNFLNAIPLFLLVLFIHGIGEKQKIFALWFILIELITSMQNSQSNGLIAALAAGALISFEKKNVLIASLLIVFSGYIKIFGLALGLMSLLYEKRIRFMVYSLVWVLIFAFIPIFFTTFKLLLMQYQSWWNLLQQDHEINLGISVYGFLHSVAGVDSGRGMVLVAGIILLLAPSALFQKFYNSRFRIFYWCSILIWMVVLNHRAESPTFIIAVTGIAIWYFHSAPSKLNTVLIIFTFVFTILSPTDLFPKIIRDDFIVPYSLKVLPCILIWMKITFELIFKKEYAIPD